MPLLLSISSSSGMHGSTLVVKFRLMMMSRSMRDHNYPMQSNERKQLDRNSHPKGKELDRESGSFGRRWCGRRRAGQGDVSSRGMPPGEHFCQIIDSLT